MGLDSILRCYRFAEGSWRISHGVNQYSSRTVPGAIDVVGIAKSDATVTVNSQTTYRKNEFYQKAITVANNANNLVTVQATSGTSTTKSGNVFVPPATEAFSYDLDGNLTQDGRWNYTWDAENRLIRLTGRVTGVSPSQVDYEYDWRGRRIKKMVTGGATSKYLYDGRNLVAEIDGNNALVRSYMWGLDLSGSVQGAGGVGGLVYTKPAAGNAHFCAYDGNGNIMALVDGGNGSVSAEYEYGAFGEPIRATGTMAISNPFRFSRKFTDDESDFLYYGYRYYNPSTGRWCNRDPLAERGGSNVYGFCSSDSVNRFDINGLFPTGLGGVISSCIKELVKQGFIQSVGSWLDKNFACGQMATISRIDPDVDLCKGHAMTYDFAAYKMTSVAQALIGCIFSGLSEDAISKITDPIEKEIAKRILDTGGKVLDDSVSATAKMRIYAKCSNGQARLSINYFTEITIGGQKLKTSVSPGDPFTCPEKGSFSRRVRLLSGRSKSE